MHQSWIFVFVHVPKSFRPSVYGPLSVYRFFGVSGFSSKYLVYLLMLLLLIECIPCRLITVEKNIGLQTLEIRGFGLLICMAFCIKL